MKTNTKIPSSYKYSKGSSLLARLSRTTLRASLFSMAIAVVAVWSVILTHASPIPSVRAVYFCPTDGCNSVNLENEKFFLNRYMMQVQSWYKSQLGRTFNYLGVSFFYGQHDTLYYKVIGPDGAIIDSLSKVPSMSLPNVKTIVMAPGQWLNSDACGVAGLNGPVGFVEGASSFKCGGDYTYSVMAHELGHTFGLYPSGDHHTNDGTLMDHQSCGGKPLANCKMNDVEKSYLLHDRLVWFPLTSPTQGGNPGNGNPSTCSGTPTLKQGSTGGCVTKLQTILLQKGYDIGTKKPDGIFGNGTTTAIKKFQFSAHVANSSCSSSYTTCDGIVGPATWASLNGSGGVTTPPKTDKPPTPTDKNIPIGHVDGADCTVDGWAFDWDNVYVSLQIHIYVDGPTGKSPNPAFTSTTNIYRSDVNNAFASSNGGKAIPGNHGFRVPIPSQYKGATHTYYVYGIGINSANLASGHNSFLGSTSGFCANGPKPQ